MKTVILITSLVICLVSQCNPAPLTESKEQNEEMPPKQNSNEIFEAKDIVGQEPNSLDEDESSGEGSGNEADFISLSKVNDINEEKTNYHEFGIDYTDSFEENENNLLEDNFGGRKCDLTFETARQLATSLYKPSAIAEYIISNNDIESFICVMEILIEDELLSEEEADYLEEQVSNELQKRLYNGATYSDNDPFEIEEGQLSSELDEDSLYPDLDGVITADMDELLYDLAQDLYQKEPQDKNAAEKTLIEFAELIAREVILGNLSPQDGAGYLDILAQLPFGQFLVPDEEDMESIVSFQEFIEGAEEYEGNDMEEKVVFDDIDALEQELKNSAKTNNDVKVQETYYPDNEAKFGAFPEYKDNYLDEFKESYAWLDDYGMLLPTDKEIAQLEDTDSDVAELAVDLGDILKYYVDTGKLSAEDVEGIRHLFEKNI